MESHFSSASLNDYESEIPITKKIDNVEYTIKVNRNIT